MNSIFRAFTAAGLLALSGCGSILSGAGPTSSAIRSAASEATYDLVDINPESLPSYTVPVRPPLAAGIGMVPIGQPVLKPGDVIKVVVSDSAQEGALFAPLSMGGTTFSGIRISGSGQINLPYVNSVDIAGATLPAAQEIIRKRLVGRSATDPQVQIELVEDVTNSVLVVGAVKTPGRFSSLNGGLTILDAINLAGGPVLEPHLIKVILRSPSNVRSLDYQTLLDGKNELLPPKTEVVLERARKRFVAMGSVASPGLHDLPSQNSTLLEVLGKVGGLRENTADPSGVFIFRGADGDGGRPTVFRLDMKNPAAIFMARQFQVQAEDAVYVTNAAVYEWQKIISPIVQVLVLGRTLDGF